MRHKIRSAARGLGLSAHSYLCLLVVFIAGFVSFSVYGLTLAPTLSWSHWGGDGGDFVTAALLHRLPHPPGFPVYMALARLFVHLPWRDPAWRLNALSAFMAAGTVSLVTATLCLQRFAPLLVLATSLTLAFAPLFWSQALIVEVYTTAAFFVATALFFATWSSRAHPGRGAPLVGLAWGLAISVHMTLWALAPLWWWLLRDAYRLRDYLHLGLGLFVGLLPYVLLPLCGSWPQPWADMRTWAGWWDFVSARLYWGYAFALPWADWPARALAWAALMARQFTSLGALCSLVALGEAKRHPRAPCLGIAIGFGLVSLYAIGYNTPDSLVYLVPVLPLLALLLASGLMRVVMWGVPRWTALLLPIFLLLWNWRAVDLHQDYAAVPWLHQVSAQVPERAVLLTHGDRQTFTMWYAQSALGLLPDVLIVDVDLWQQSAYREFLTLQTGDVLQPEDLAAGRPLCVLETEEVACP